MIKINTRDFGEIEISEDRIFTFPGGVFAFEDTRRFALISPLGEGVFPMWLQCLDAIKPCFIVFDPSIIDSRYQFSLTKSEEKLLGITEETDIQLLVIAKVPSDYRETTVNMKSPIIINKDQRVATQVILPHDYLFRLPIYHKGEQEEGAS